MTCNRAGILYEYVQNIHATSGPLKKSQVPCITDTIKVFYSCSVSHTTGGILRALDIIGYYSK